MLTKERTPATTQVTDCRRPTGMPSMEARSRRSPAACTAIPTSLRVNQSDTAARQTDRDDDRHQVVGVEHDGREVPG